MDLKIKSFFVLINAVVSLSSLLTPTETMALTFVLSVSFAIQWVFETERKNTWSKILVGIYLAIAYIAIGMSFFLALSSELNVMANGACEFVIKENVMCIGGEKFPYEFFLSFSIPMMMILIVGDYINSIVLLAIKNKKQGGN